MTSERSPTRRLRIRLLLGPDPALRISSRAANPRLPFPRFGDIVRESSLAGNGARRLSMNGVLSVSQPELYPEVFPENHVPRFRVEGERASFLPESVWVTETTLRDGQQGGIPFTTEQAVRVYELMDRIGGPGHVIRQ